MNCLSKSSGMATRSAVRPAAYKPATRTTVLVRAQQQQHTSGTLKASAALFAAGVAISLALAPQAQAISLAEKVKQKEADYQQQLKVLEDAFERQQTIASKSVKAPSLGEVSATSGAAKSASQVKEAKKISSLV